MHAPPGAQLGDNIWLFSAENDLSFFARLLLHAEQFGIRYKIHFFEKEPQWLGTWKTTPELKDGAS